MFFFTKDSPTDSDGLHDLVKWKSDQKRRGKGEKGERRRATHGNSKKYSNVSALAVEIVALIACFHLRAFAVVKKGGLEGRASGGVGLRTSNLLP